jgi:phosphinothricin acetyltransferase
MIIRPLIASDYPQVAAIYKKGLATGIATFETMVPAWNSWNQKFLECCRYVLENKGEVIGWCTLSSVSIRKVYHGVAEDTIYIDPDYQGKSLGKMLLQYLITESEKNGFWTLQAVIFSQNKSSIALHKSCGFRKIGIREKIAKRDGKWHDNVIMERRSEKMK